MKLIIKVYSSEEISTVIEEIMKKLKECSLTNTTIRKVEFDFEE